MDWRQDINAEGRQHWNAGRSLGLYCWDWNTTTVATSWDLFTSVATGHTVILCSQLEH